MLAKLLELNDFSNINMDKIRKGSKRKRLNTDNGNESQKYKILYHSRNIKINKHVSSKQQYTDRQELNKTKAKNGSFNIKKSRPRKNTLNESDPNEEVKATNILDENEKLKQKSKDDHESQSSLEKRYKPILKKRMTLPTDSELDTQLSLENKSKSYAAGVQQEIVRKDSIDDPEIRKRLSF